MVLLFVFIFAFHLLVIYLEWDALLKKLTFVLQCLFGLPLCIKVGSLLMLVASVEGSLEKRTGFGMEKPLEVRSGVLAVIASKTMVGASSAQSFESLLSFVAGLGRHCRVMERLSLFLAWMLQRRAAPTSGFVL